MPLTNTPGEGLPTDCTCVLMAPDSVPNAGDDYVDDSMADLCMWTTGGEPAANQRQPPLRQGASNGSATATTMCLTGMSG